MSRHRKILLVLLLTLIGLLSFLLVIGVGDPEAYGLIRLMLSFIGLLGVLALFVQSLRRVKQMNVLPMEQRLRMGTIVYMLAGITVLLTITSAYDWDRPPPTDPVLSVLGVMIRASIAFGATILALTAPED